MKPVKKLEGLKSITFNESIVKKELRIIQGGYGVCSTASNSLTVECIKLSFN